MDQFKINALAVRLSILTVSALLTACGDSGAKIQDADIRETISAQAIDGYIVNGQVLCDNVDSGRTAAAGWLECPADTTLITVNGGSDVGFDANATTGGTLFTGSLRAPGGTPYVTPISSLATQLASSDGSFNSSEYDAALSLIQNRLGLESVDLNGNPATDIELARLNIEINLLVQQFSSNTSDYSLTMKALAEVFEANMSIDMTDGVALTSAVNQQLTSIAPHLSLNSSEEIEVGNKVNAELESTKTAETIEQLENSADLPPLAAFRINQNAPLISLTRRYFSNSDSYTLTEFSSSEQDSALYQVAFSATTMACQQLLQSFMH